MEIKMLEQVAGFLNHVARAYPLLKIYLNGIYATMNAWRPDRDEAGWKTGEERVDYDTLDAPKKVRILDRLEYDLYALEQLTQQEEPPKQSARPSQVARPRYLFGDASSYGFGMSEW